MFVFLWKSLNLINCDLIGKKKNFRFISYQFNSGRIYQCFIWASVSGINWPKSSFGWQQKLNPDQTLVNKPIFINLITSNLIKDVMMELKSWNLKVNSEIMTNNRRLDYFPLQHMARFLHVYAYLFLKALNNMFDYEHILDKSEFVINI